MKPFFKIPENPSLNIGIAVYYKSNLKRLKLLIDSLIYKPIEPVIDLQNINIQTNKSYMRMLTNLKPEKVESVKNIIDESNKLWYYKQYLYLKHCSSDEYIRNVYSEKRAEYVEKYYSLFKDEGYKHYQNKPFKFLQSEEWEPSVSKSSKSSSDSKLRELYLKCCKNTDNILTCFSLKNEMTINKNYIWNIEENGILPYDENIDLLFHSEYKDEFKFDFDSLDDVRRCDFCIDIFGPMYKKNFIKCEKCKHLNDINVHIIVDGVNLLKLNQNENEEELKLKRALKQDEDEEQLKDLKQSTELDQTNNSLLQYIKSLPNIFPNFILMEVKTILV